MLQRLSGAKTSKYIQTGTEILTVLLFFVWVALIGYIIFQKSYQIAGLFVIFTLLIAGLAFANERPD